MRILSLVVSSTRRVIGRVNSRVARGYSSESAGRSSKKEKQGWWNKFANYRQWRRDRRAENNFGINMERLREEAARICDEELKRGINSLKEEAFEKIKADLSDLSSQFIAFKEQQIDGSKATMEVEKSKLIADFRQSVLQVQEERLVKFSEVVGQYVETIMQDAKARYLKVIGVHEAAAKKDFVGEIKVFADAEMKRFSEVLSVSFEQKIEIYKQSIESEMKVISDRALTVFQTKIDKMLEDKLVGFSEQVVGVSAKKVHEFDFAVKGVIERQVVAAHDKVNVVISRALSDATTQLGEVRKVESGKFSDEVEDARLKYSYYVAGEVTRLESHAVLAAKKISDQARHYEQQYFDKTDKAQLEFQEKSQKSQEGFQSKVKDSERKFDEKVRQAEETVEQTKAEGIRKIRAEARELSTSAFWRYIKFTIACSVILFLAILFLDLAYTYFWKDDEVEDLLDKLIYLDEFEKRLKFLSADFDSHGQGFILDKLPAHFLTRFNLKLLPFLFFNSHIPAADDLVFAARMLLRYEYAIAKRALIHLEEVNYSAIYSVYPDDITFMKAYAFLQLGQHAKAWEILGDFIKANYGKDSNALARCLLLRARIPIADNSKTYRQELLERVINGNFDIRYKILASKELGLGDQAAKLIEEFKKSIRGDQFARVLHHRDSNMQDFLDRSEVIGEVGAVQPKVAGVAPMTTNYDYALMTNIADGKSDDIPQQKKTLEAKGWVYKETTRDLQKKNFDLELYHHKATDELVIVIKFNETDKDIANAVLFDAGINEPTTLTTAVFNGIEGLIRQERERGGISQYTKVTLTGYQTGATLAEITLWQLMNRRSLENTMSAVTFNSTGSLPVIEQLEAKYPKPNLKKLPESATTFLTAPDKFNTLRKHGAKVIQVGVGEKLSVDWFARIGRAMGYWLPEKINGGPRNNKAYGMGEIVEAFTGGSHEYPVKIERWPVGFNERLLYVWYEAGARARSRYLVSPNLALGIDESSLDKCYRWERYDVTKGDFSELSDDVQQYLYAYVHTLGNIDKTADRDVLKFSINKNEITVHSGYSMEEFNRYVEQRARAFKTQQAAVSEPQRLANYRESYLGFGANNRLRFFADKVTLEGEANNLGHFSAVAKAPVL